MNRQFLLIIIIGLLFSIPSTTAQLVSAKKVDSYFEYLEKHYIHLHSSPELSFLEKNTSEYLAMEVESLGFSVTRNLGGYGIVAVLENGDGPSVLIRADMDALPVKEETGLAYASNVVMEDVSGENVSVMHACGHDVHMTVWIGAAKYLSEHRHQWKGKLIFIAQPAEERSGGAKAMLADGLYSKFGLPDYAIALHVSADMASSHVGLCPGYAMANVDMMRIKIKGQGGHGAQPQTTKDPIVMASQLVLDLQTIVSREISPFDPAVVTVGSFHGGTKGNVIPNDVELELTMRSYSDEIRQKIIEAIERKCEALGKSAGLNPEMYPEIHLRDEFTPALYNDPELTYMIEKVFVKELGREKVSIIGPETVGEDFGRFGRTEEKIPILMYRLGTLSQEMLKEFENTGKQVPTLHSSTYSPDVKASLTTGVHTMTSAVMALLKL